MRWVLDTRPIPRTPAPELDPEQRAVVSHRGSAQLVLAGPGTGKTTTLVETVVRALVDDQMRADQILVLTFGRRAAGEIRDRIAARVGGGSLPRVATFHSFAYSFVQQGPDITPPRLLSGAEEDVRIRDLLLGAVEDGTVQWPEDLTAALPTLGLANEVRAVLARSRTLGIEPERLAVIGRLADRPAWQAVGALALQERQVSALQDVMDYTDLLTRAIAQAQQPGHPTYRLIVVDEYQDTDPLQVALLQALVGAQTTLIAVGDPDQAIYGFRGADVRAISRFATDFPSAAEPIVLRQARRFGPQTMHAATAVLGHRAIAGIPSAIQRAHRDATCVGGGDDLVEITTYDSVSTLAAHIAEQIAEAHVERGIPWQELAVITRTAQDMIAVERALLSGHIPVAMNIDDIPLRLEPAVAVLLQALRIALRPSALRASDVVGLLTGPLCGLSVDQVRQWGRALRRAARAETPFPPSAEELMREAIIGAPLVVESETEQRVNGLQALLHAAHERITKFGTPADVLWLLWSGRVTGQRTHGWPERLSAAAIRGSRTANHDLDAVMALFDAAERFAGRKSGAAGIRDFLDSLAAQQLPAEAVAERGLRSDAVRILTAHRAKGLEWDEVWIVGLQEGTWPNVRPRGSVLEPQRLERDGLGTGPDVTDLLAEERRLGYVALTRARSRVHVAVVDEPTGSQPSRFIDELSASGVAVITHDVARPPRATSLTSLVGELRRHLDDERDGPAAAALLAELAGAVDDDGIPLAPLADPREWWGMHERTVGVEPIVPTDAPIPVSGSVVESVTTCPRRWFLERRVQAQSAERNAAATGTIVHGIAEFVGRGELPPDLDELDPLVDRVWHALSFEAPWQSGAERERARTALRAFLGYHLKSDRVLEQTEQSFSAALDVPAPDGGTERVLLTGKIDRLERDVDGLLYPVDLKTSRVRVSEREAEEHPQLGVYQVLVQRSGDSVGGATLVQLGLDKREAVVTTQPSIPADGASWIEDQIGAAAHTIRAERFWAQPNTGCRHCPVSSSCPAQPEGEAL